ncbi:hypothetical protein PQR34_48040 [Paraburkholderia sediminicola]|uniref:hypothetical protein n=1 Tax=Paraburkholderia sediminicola TaxID=458836 RepID=UPI0038B9A604
MPLIEFPDVPPMAGVPDLNRLPLAVGVLTGITPAIQGLDYFNLLPADVPQWILADDQGNALVTPDSVVELGFRGEQSIPSYPVEAGSFAAYNKVATLSVTGGAQTVCAQHPDSKGNCIVQAENGATITGQQVSLINQGGATSGSMRLRPTGASWRTLRACACRAKLSSSQAVTRSSPTSATANLWMARKQLRKA